MILGQDVLRLLTVKALKGRTWAGERVYDSPAQPADLKIAEERAPFIGVYTDDADADTQRRVAAQPRRAGLSDHRMRGRRPDRGAAGRA